MKYDRHWNSLHTVNNCLDSQMYYGYYNKVRRTMFYGSAHTANYRKLFKSSHVCQMSMQYQ